MPVGRDLLGGEEADLARPGRELEHLVARLQPERVDHPDGDGHGRAAHRLRLRRPALGRGSPAGAALLAVVGGVGHLSSRRSSLPEGVRGSSADPLERLRHLVAGEPLRAVVAQLGGVGRRVGRGHEQRGHRLAPLRVRAGEHRRLGDAGVLLQHRLDLGGRDVLAAGHDRVGLAADHGQAALVVEAAEVAGAQRVPLPHHGRAGDEDLAVLRHGEAGAGQRAAGGLEVARVGERDRAARLGQPVGLGDREARVGGAAQQRGRARAAAEHDPAQPRAGAAAGVEDAGEHGRDQRGERDVALLQRAGGALGVERLEHDRARGGGASAPGSSARRRARAASGTASARRGRCRARRRRRGCGRRRCRR